MLLAFPILIVAGPPLLWTILSLLPHTVPKELTNTSVSLLVSHPDDESMFFAPTLQNILDPANNNTVKVISLSNGNAEGLGKIRTSELRNAVRLLGGQNVDEQVHVVDHPELQDSMTAEWDPKIVAEVIEKVVTSDVLVTFDDKGISGHPNHIAAYTGAVRWKGSKPSERSVWVLEDVPIYRKYLSLVDALFTYVYNEYLSEYVSPGLSDRKAVILNSQVQFERAKNAMVKGHPSQLKWYRWFYLQFSRYMVVNELLEI